MIFPRRRFKSSISSAKQRTAIISEATVMTKWSSLTIPSILLPSPTTTFRRTLSFISRHLFQMICLGSMPSSFPCWIWLSKSAANRLFAEVIAWKSPVKCKFRSSIGTTWAYPPPAAPPLIPKHGPKDGSLNAMTAFFPSFPNACPKPTLVVVFPSPAGVGLIAVTSTSFPSGSSFNRSNNSSENFALYFPYNSNSSSLISSLFATSVIGSITASCAIWISLFILFLHHICKMFL